MSAPFADQGTVRWQGHDRFEVGGLAFSAGAPAEGAVTIVKPPHLIGRYLDVLRDERPDVIVELGTREGGSAAMMLAAGRPSTLVTVDLAADLPPALVSLRRDPDLGPRLVAHCGVDQADGPTLATLVDDARRDRPLDLVVDDASHVLGPSRASFAVLYPRVRPGGIYIVEDWSSEAVLAARLAQSLDPAHPEFPERLALVRALVHQLNQPGYVLPDDARDALGRAAAGRAPSVELPALFRFIAVIVDASAVVDLDALRQVAMDDLPRPLVDMAVELSMVAATRPDVVAEVRLTWEWILVRRGEADLPLEGVALDGLWHDHYGYLG